MASTGQTPEDRQARLAARRANRGRLKDGTRREQPGDARLAAALRARGEDVKGIAIALEFSDQRARYLLRRPDVRALIGRFRELHRVQTMDKTSEMTPRLFHRMGTAIDRPDDEAVGVVKDLAKTVLDLERVAASVSGELKGATTTIQVQNLLAQQNGTDPKQQLTELLSVLEAGGA